MRVACCQFDIAWEDKPANYRRVEAMVRDARLDAETLLLLPEMFATGFTMSAGQVAEAPEGPTARFLADLATRHRLYVLAGVVVAPAEAGGRPRNEALLFNPDGRRVGRYAKAHLFNYAGEGDHYAAGGGPVVVELAGLRLQPAVCYDLRFPELFRDAPGPAPELIAVIANWPAPRESHWLALLRARAIENQAYVAGVNRCGRDPKVEYSGRSQIIDPRGEVVADGSAGEAVIRADLDLGRLKEYRTSFPALQDRRGAGPTD